MCMLVRSRTWLSKDPCIIPLPLLCGEGVVLFHGSVGAAYSDQEMVHLGEGMADRVQVTQMEGLEPADQESAGIASRR